MKQRLVRWCDALAWRLLRWAHPQELGQKGAVACIGLRFDDSSKTLPFVFLQTDRDRAEANGSTWTQPPKAQVTPTLH